MKKQILQKLYKHLQKTKRECSSQGSSCAKHNKRIKIRQQPHRKVKLETNLTYEYGAKTYPLHQKAICKKREPKTTKLVSRMKSEYKSIKCVKAIHHIKLKAS